MGFIQFPLKPKNELEQGGRTTSLPAEEESELCEQCPNCRKQIPVSLLWERQYTCPCGHHLRWAARQRVAFLADGGSFCELWGELFSTDILQFPGYQRKLENSRLSSGEQEGVICGRCTIDGQDCMLFVMNPYFMMGSMGMVVGEKITRLFETAAQNSLPVVGYTVSGGARMQEGILSLMQMAKVSGAVKRHSDLGLFYLTVLTDPTTGGVTASFAMEGDIILAEPGATVGFAGARVIEQTVRKKLPADFQKSEFLLEHGFVDAIVPRKKQRETVAFLLKLHQGGDVG